MGEDDADRMPGKLARRVWLSVAAMAGAGALVAVPVVGFVIAPVFRKVRERWRSIGPLEDFPVGETVKVDFDTMTPVPWSGVTARTGAWVRRTGPDRLVAFAVNCTHLGCPVRFVSDAELFMCPCHGGVYYADGSVAAGPPPHDLWRYPIRTHGGKVQIRTAPLPITTS